MIDEVFALVNDRIKVIKTLTIAKSAIRHNMAKDLPKMHVKTCLIWGKEDITTPFAQSDSLNSILHTQFFPVENARHLPHLEYPSLVNSRIILFLK